MPELPEVETIARGVQGRVRGDRIVEVWFSSHREPFKTSPSRQSKGLEGRAIVAVHRTGKHIVCELGPPVSAPTGQAAKRALPAAEKHTVLKGHDLSRAVRAAKSTRALAPEGCFSDDSPGIPPSSATPQAESASAQWIVHLGMTGRLLVTTADAPVATHTHARLTLASGRELRFVDARRFGRLEFRDLLHTDGFRGPGAEPLLIEAADFAALFHGRKLAIKAALLNQTMLAGVGNIYADESLFRAGIRPARRSGRLTKTELERLRQALREVLEQAIRQGGSSVSDYVDANGERGFFQLEHCVYQRTGQPCRRCQTPIRRIWLAGRGTHYCPHCQH